VVVGREREGGRKEAERGEHKTDDCERAPVVV
jgi:hypothetical protein